MKQILQRFLAICACCVLCLSAHAVTIKWNSYTFTLTAIGTNRYQMERVTPAPSGSFTVYNVYSTASEYYNVCSLWGTFSGASKLTSVTIANGIESIGISTFANCTSLQSVTLPSGLLRIYENAFLNCTALRSITLPSSVEYIGEDAFKGCTNLSTVYVENMLWYYSRQSKISLPSGVTVIPLNEEDYTVTYQAGASYQDRTDIYSVVIPASITSIAANAFKGCTNLKKVFFQTNTVPDGITSAFDAVSNRVTYVPKSGYESYASKLGEIRVYSNLSSLFEVDGLKYVYVPETRSAEVVDCDYHTTNIVVPNNVTNPVNTNISLPVTKVNKLALTGHMLMTDFTIGGTVQTIEDYAFGDCKQLNTITFEEGDNAITLGSAGSAGLFKNCQTLNTININRPLSYDHTQGKGRSPFYGNTSMQIANVGGKETTIYDNEFEAINTSLQTLNVSGQVSLIENGAFDGSRLTSVSIDANNTVIGASAFQNCTSLTSLTLGRGIGNIGASAFSGCTALASSVTINPYNTITIGANAFNNCKKLGSIVIGETVSTIGGGAFMNCSAATTITLRSGLETIGERAFKNCAAARQFNLCEDITSIGSEAFSGCAAITSMAFPSQLTTISDSICTDCTSLNAVTMNSAVSSIGNYAFKGTTALKSITLPASLTSLGSHAFNASGIESVTIPAGVTALLGGTFQNSGLKSIETSNVAAIGESCFASSPLESLTIHPVVTSIADGALNGCTSLATLNIQEGTTALTVGKNASGQGLFRDCKLDNTTISRVLTHPASDAGYSPFAGNTKMKNVTINGKALTMPASMFRDCSALDNVTLAETVQSIGDYAFASSGVRTINIPSKVSVIPAHCFDSAPRLITMTLPATVTSIGSYAYTASGIQTLEIPGSVNAVGDHCFYNCKSLQSITLGDGVRTINQYAFAASTLPLLVVPASVTNIGNAAFDDCTNFGTLRIEDGSATLGLGINQANQGMFYDCPLTTVYIGRNTSFSGGSANGYSPFALNHSLKTVEFGDVPTEVYAYEFSECTALDDVKLGDGITAISERAFNLCSALKTFEMGTSVQNVGTQAFADCTGLTEFRSYSAVPPVCGGDALADISKWNCTLYVPNNSVRAYEDADQWHEFLAVVGFDATIHVSYIEMNQSEATFDAVGQTVQLSVTSYPQSATLGALTWTSSDENVATVSSNGLVTAVGRGTATITATEAEGISATCVVTVDVPDPVVTSIALNKQTLTLTEGETATLTATTLPAEVQANVTWTSSNNAVATVSSTGVVTAIAAGTATITATETRSGLAATCAVTVEAAPVIVDAPYMMYMEDMNVRKGDVIDIPVYLKNDLPVYSFNCDVVVPEGLSVVRNDYGYYDIKLGGRKTPMHIITSEDQDGNVRVVCYSNRNLALLDNDEPLFYIPVVVSDEVEPETNLVIGLSRIYIVYGANSDAFEQYLAPDVSATLSVGKAFTPGDVNDDGLYTALDISMTVSYVLGKTPANSIAEAADMNQDGIYTALDISMVVACVLNGGPRTASLAPARKQAEEEGHLESMFLAGTTPETAHTQWLRLDVTNLSEYIAAQFDVAVPEGMKVKDVRMANGDTSHRIAFSETSGGEVRVVAYSPLNTYFRGSFVEILVENESAAPSHVLDLHNVLLTSKSGNHFAEHKANGLTIGADVTGIEKFASDGQQEIYNLGGVRVKTSGKGVFIVNGKKVSTK